MSNYNIQETIFNSLYNDNIKLSIIIPAYNEENNIARVIENLILNLNKYSPYNEIIVIDDGSLDNTLEILEKYNVKIIKHENNCGKGVALRSGFMASTGEIIITMDADGSHFAGEIPKLLNELIKNEKIDYVIGSRFIRKNGKITTKMNIIGNRIFNYLIYILNGKKLTDSQSGFRAFKKSAIEKIEIDSKGFEVETELTIKSLKEGNLVEVPVKVDKRDHGKSHLKPFEDGFRILKAIIKYS